MNVMRIGENIMKISELLEAKVEMCPDACCGKPVTECKCGPDCKHCDCYAKNKAMNEGLLRNLVGDVRNAFKPGVAVTPNMVKELEAGLAAIRRGEQPTRRQQATFDNFMSDTLAKELKKMGISETTSAGSVASSMGSGNGFVGGGIGTISRAPGSKKPKKKKDTNTPS